MPSCPILAIPLSLSTFICGKRSIINFEKCLIPKTKQMGRNNPILLINLLTRKSLSSNKNPTHCGALQRLKKKRNIFLSAHKTLFISKFLIFFKRSQNDFSKKNLPSQRKYVVFPSNKEKKTALLARANPQIPLKNLTPKWLILLSIFPL